MLFSRYQNQAHLTNQLKSKPLQTRLEMFSLGLAYEAGSVLNTVQLYRLIGDNYASYKPQLAEELGDCLWYLASLATMFECSLRDLAKENILYSQTVFNKESQTSYSGNLRKNGNDTTYYSMWVKRTDLKKDAKVSVLGLVGETGSIATICKKIFRENCRLKKYRKDMRKEIGDCLWYITSIANNNGLKLKNVLEQNLIVTQRRWVDYGMPVSDQKYEFDERLPRKFRVRFKEKIVDENTVQTIMEINGVFVGDRLTDNSYFDDGYRYHDVFHFAYAAILGWSPVLRGLLKRKRKSHPDIDEVEDGARAAIVEEAISLLVYNHASDFNYFKNIKIVDDSILRSIQTLVQDLEVEQCTGKLWERAILKGYEVFNLVWENRGGILKIDLDNRDIKYLKVR